MRANGGKRQFHHSRFPLCLLLAAILAAGALGACGRAQEEAPPEPAEEAPAAEEKTVFPRYRTERADVSKGKEAVLIQQATEEGFLALINRQVRDETPEELLEDPDFVNDGRYAVYENALFRVDRGGKREMVERYAPGAAPENPEDWEEYFSEVRLRAVRLREDGCFLAVESSFESWQDDSLTPRYRTRDRYTLRILEPDGSERASFPLEAEEDAAGPDWEQAVLLPGGLLAAPQGNAVLMVDEEGARRFTVETPFPVSELCAVGGGALAVILEEGGLSWISVVQTADRSVTVPVEIPADAHGFCEGPEPGSVCFLRRSEIFKADAATGESEKLCSLLSLGVNPSELGAFSVQSDGSLTLLVNAWDPETETVKTEIVTAAPVREDHEEPAGLNDPPADSGNPANSAPDGETDAGGASAAEAAPEQTVLTLGFLSLSDRMEEALIRFNASQTQVRVEAVDYGNLSEEELCEHCPDLVVMDQALYRRLSGERKLADLSALLREDREYGEEDLNPAVLRALQEEDGSLRRMAGVFRIESMVCAGEAVGGRTELSMDDLREILSGMPAGSSLYEPYYTSDRLLEALTEVNRRNLTAGGQHNGVLYARLRTFAGLQPETYDNTDFVLDGSSMESRMEDGRLLLTQAHIGSLEELKRYDAFFYGDACFVGWPTEDSSYSRLFFDEMIGVGEHCTQAEREAAWQFARCVLEEAYSDGSYGFPTRASALERQLDADAAAVSYRLDKDGDVELDKNGDPIESARSVWYSPEWNRHYEYAITGAQREKLLRLIGHSV